MHAFATNPVLVGEAFEARLVRTSGRFGYRLNIKIPYRLREISDGWFAELRTVNFAVGAKTRVRGRTRGLIEVEEMDRHRAVRGRVQLPERERTGDGERAPRLEVAAGVASALPKRGRDARRGVTRRARAAAPARADPELVVDGAEVRLDRLDRRGTGSARSAGWSSRSRPARRRAARSG